MKTNELREVGNHLKRAYRKAVQIENNGLKQRKSVVEVARWKLAYLQDSPNYCLATGAHGSNGTLGRRCSMRKGKEVPVEERKSCRRLCRQCGYRVTRHLTTVTTSCNCKFKLCCEITCQQCTREEYAYVCGPQ